MSRWNFGEGKTFSSASEAFRDADYATPIWRCESEWDRSKDMLVTLVVFMVAIGFIYIFIKGFILWLSL